MPDLSPASSTGRLQLPLTAPNPRAIVLPDTRPPETQRLSLCKGKAEREPAVTGGLVSHDQAKRSRAAPVGPQVTPTGSERAAICVAWSACQGHSGDWQPGMGAHPAAASIGRLPARQVVSPGAKMQVHPATLPLDLVDPAFAVARNQAPSPVARRPEAAAAAWPADLPRLSAQRAQWYRREGEGGRRPRKWWTLRAGPLQVE